MNVETRIKKLNEQRLHAWSEAKRLLDDVDREHRDMSGEESAQWQKMNADIDDLDAEIRQLVERERREVEAAELRMGSEHLFGQLGHNDHDEASELRSFLRGDGPQHLAIPLDAAAKERRLIREGASGREARALAWDTGSIASAVPTSMARTMYEYMEASVLAFRAPTTQIITTGGENLDFPRVSAHSIATQVAGQGTAFAGTDPDFDKMTLGSYKYGQLVIVANEVIEDAAVDVATFLGRDLGRGVGRLIDTDLITGSGSGQPTGMMQAALSCGSVSTGGTLIGPTYENLVDTLYSIDDEYRARESAAWMFRDSTAGEIRKLRSEGGTVGVPLWQPSVIGGQPDTLLGYPVYTDPNIASMASNARIGAFTDMSAYYIRAVGNVRIELDRSRYFDTDQSGIRAKLRVDGNLIDTNALVSLIQNV